MQKENALTNSFREINDYYIIIAVGTDRSVINKSECCDNATDNHEFFSTQDVVISSPFACGRGMDGIACLAS